MKIAIISDTHAGAKNGSDLFANYQNEFYSKIFFPYLKKHDIKQIIHMGDFFDNRRVINFKIINNLRRSFLDILRAEDIKMDIIPGNHDTFYRSTNDLCSLKELLGHYTDCVSIYMKPMVVDYDGLNIGLLPWIAADTYDESMKFIDSCNAPILMGHLELAGFKFMANSNVVSHGEIPTKFKRFEAVYSGHYHTKSSSNNITYLGTQMEFTWSDCDDPKFFHVFDTETRTIEAIRNPITLYKKIYYEDTDIDTLKKEDIENKYVKVIVISKKDLFAFDQFIDRVSSMKPHDVSIVERFDDITEEEADNLNLEDTGTLLTNYVDSLDTNYNKDILKRMLMQLYQEAQDVDAI